MEKEIKKLIFLDKAVIFLKNNLTKSRSEIEEGLEDIIKQNIMKYLTNKVGYSKTEINHKNKTVLKVYRLGAENDFFVSENLKELGMEIEVFENGVGITG